MHREVAKPDQHPRNALLHGKYQPTQILKHTHTHTENYEITVTPLFKDPSIQSLAAVLQHLQAAKALRPLQDATGHSSEVDAQHQAGLNTQPWEIKQALAAYTQEETGGERKDLTPRVPQEQVPSSTSAGSSEGFRIRHWQILVQTLMHMVHLVTDTQTHIPAQTHTSTPPIPAKQSFHQLWNEQGNPFQGG